MRLRKGRCMMTKINTGSIAYSDTVTIVWSHLVTVTIFCCPNFPVYTRIKLVTVTQYKPFAYSDTYWPFLRVTL